MYIDDAYNTLSSLITYNANTTSKSMDIPELYIDRILFISFINSSSGSILYTNNRIVVTLSKCTFANNIANNGGSIYFNNTMNSTINIIECQFSDNLAKINGGAIYFDSNIFSINIISSVFNRNTATNGGGAIYMYKNTKNINILNTQFISNTNTGNNGGGAINFKMDIHEMIYIFNCTFMYNTARLGIKLLIKSH